MAPVDIQTSSTSATSMRSDKAMPAPCKEAISLLPWGKRLTLKGSPSVSTSMPSLPTLSSPPNQLSCTSFPNLKLVLSQTVHHVTLPSTISPALDIAVYHTTHTVKLLPAPTSSTAVLNSTSSVPNLKLPFSLHLKTVPTNLTSSCAKVTHSSSTAAPTEPAIHPPVCSLPPSTDTTYISNADSPQEMQDTLPLSSNSTTNTRPNLSSSCLFNINPTAIKVQCYPSALHVSATTGVRIGTVVRRPRLRIHPKIRELVEILDTVSQ